MRQYTLALFFGFVSLLSSGPVGSEVATPKLDLEEVVREAMDHNPRIVVAHARWEVALEEAPQARSLDAPSLYIMFWAVPDDTPNPHSARETWYGIKQRFPFPGKLDLKGQVADRTADIAEARYRSVRDEVIRHVKTAYFELFLLDRESEITSEHRDLMRDLAEIAESRYATAPTGGPSLSDVLKAQVEISILSNRLTILAQQRVVAVARLNLLLDRPPDGPLGRPVVEAIRKVEDRPAVLRQAARENRPELQATRQAIDRAEASIMLAKRSYYPDFMTDFSYWNVRNSRNRWMLMVEAKIPIAFWSRGRYDARARQAAVEKQAWLSELGELRNQVLFEIEEALVEVRIAQSNADLYRRTIIPQARLAVDALRASYETDRASFFSLVDSERTLLRFELAYYRALVESEKGIANLERAVGASLELRREQL